MVISYHGIGCFKVTLGDVVIAFNPLSKDADLKSTRFSSDIAIISLNDKNYNGVSAVSGGARELFVIDGPGEYEAGGIYVKGFGIEETIGAKKVINTIYSVVLDDINLCHVGALNVADIKPEIKEELGEIDILFVPMTGSASGGKGDLLSPADASKLVNLLEPKLVIPMTHTVDGVSKTSLASFLKEAGAEGVSPMDKLTIKKKDLEGKEGEVVVLTPAI